MPSLPVTSLYAGILALWIMALAIEVGRRRTRHKVLMGSGGVVELERAVRGHGNAIETIPIALILLGLTEGMGAPGAALHAAGLTLIVGRVIHGLHFVAMPDRLILRAAGMLLTALAIVLLALGLIGHVLFGGGAS